MNALVVIDVQKYSINEFTKDIPQKISDYIKENKDKFDFIVFFKFVNNENSPFVKFYNWRNMMNPPETDLSPELEKIPHELFIKSTRSCLRNDEFKKFLKDNKIEELYLCGFNTEECVMATAFDAFDCGFNVFILKELCASSYGKENHERAIELLKNQFEVV